MTACCRSTVVIGFDNYWPVDGVMFAHGTNEQRISRKSVQSLVTDAERVAVNVPMYDSMFAPPAVK